MPRGLASSRQDALARPAGIGYFLPMSSVKEIEFAVAQLSCEDLGRFRTWFADFDADTWDRQFEADAVAGRLDALGDEALRDLDEGQCRDL